MILSHNQKLAISHVKGPALILAVPGAGKTTVLIHRTANLILNEAISPEKILSITFSKASARDMKERFYNLYGDITPLPIHFSTIHSFAYSLIKEYAFKNRIKYTLIENMDKEINKYNILRNIYLSLNKGYLTEENLESLVNAIGYIKNMLIRPEKYVSQFGFNMKNFVKIYEAYEKYKKDRNFIDFDDMLTLALDLLKSDRYLISKYRRRYEYIQVDEGQDTSRAQLEIIKTLAYPKNNLLIVADDDQSIYGFRGAYPQGLFEFNKFYKKAKIFYMEKNFRSSKNIVSLSNSFIKKNTLRYSKEIYTDNTYVEPVKIIKGKTLEDQYYYIIEDLENSNSYEDIAILYRNNISAVGLVDFLEKNNIPFHTRDRKLKFFNHWILQDIISFFLLAYDESNIQAFEKIYFKMNGFISKSQLNYVKSHNNGSVFLNLLNIPGLNNFYKNKFLELKLGFKKLSKLGVFEGIQYIENSLAYGDYLKEASMKFGYNPESLNIILFYLKIIGSNTRKLKDFLARLKYLEYIYIQSSQKNKGLSLSTIHSAKGLEFEKVYIIDLIEGDFPSTTSIDSFKKGNFEILEEERRLFYVGMTRAKKFLTLVTYLNREEESLSPSRFIGELEKLNT